jgi:hypothetical protein
MPWCKPNESNCRNSEKVPLNLKAQTVTGCMLQCVLYHLTYTLYVCRATDGNNVTEINCDILEAYGSLFFVVLSYHVK